MSSWLCNRVLVNWVNLCTLTMGDRVRIRYMDSHVKKWKHAVYSTYQLPNYTEHYSILSVFYYYCYYHYFLSSSLFFISFSSTPFIFPQFATYAQGGRPYVLNDDTTFEQLLVYKNRKENCFNAICHWKQNCKNVTCVFTK